jgi:hypothetical protein
MTWATELQKIRYYLRDPNAKIWTNDLLLNLFNQAQNELQQRSQLLEDVTSIELPPEFGSSYTHDWEWGFIEGSKYRALKNQGNNFSYCYQWEIQENFGEEADISDVGCNYTQPFEAFLGLTSNTPPAIPLPVNLHHIKNMYHDREPLSRVSKKDLTNTDSSYLTREGEPIAYYFDDEVSNTFYLYGRPSTVTWTDDADSGMVNSVEDDTTGSETGTITKRTGSVLSGENGIVVDVVEDDDNITVIYDISPSDVTGLGDDLDFPSYLTKYIRYRVLELAYGANTDGRIESLAGYWRNRARIGLEFVNQFKIKRHRDRNYQLSLNNPSRKRNFKHARLPDTYPQ